MNEPVRPDTANMVMSPMAGTLVSINVKAGDVVVVGQELAVVEAMKMLNPLHASRDGKVKEVKGVVGNPLQLDEIILELEGLKK